MQGLIRHLQFRPHGDNLLTQSAAFWLISIRFLVFAMALTEGIAWGYLGYLFGDGSIRWIAAGFTGIIVFFIVWMIDLSLITSDRAWSEHAAKLLGEKPVTTGYRAMLTASTLLFRVVLVAGSLTITAPYLAQLVFQKDIAQVIANDAIKALDGARQRVGAQYDLDIAKKSYEIGDKRKAYEAETAGTGSSGQRGEGPAARAILRDEAKLENERQQLIQDRQKALDTFNGLSENWLSNRELLAERYKVDLPREGVSQNRLALEEVRARPESHQVELAIKAFLAFIFAGILLLKLFEPSSIRLYMSEVLQQEYSRYRAGAFDKYLPSEESSSNARYKISPQRLYGFLVSTVVPNLQNDQEIRNELKRKQLFESAREESEFRRIEALKQVEFQEQLTGRQTKLDRAAAIEARNEKRRLEQDAVDDRVHAAHLRIDAARGAVEHLYSQRGRVREDFNIEEEALKQSTNMAAEAESSLDDLKATIDVVEQDIAYFDHELESLESRKATLDGKGAADVAQIQTALREKRGDANHSLVGLKQALGKEEKEYERSIARFVDASTRREKVQQQIDEIDAKITEMERQIAAEAIDAGSSILGPAQGAAIPDRRTAARP